jgi:hypothetical protein
MLQEIYLMPLQFYKYSEKAWLLLRTARSYRQSQSPLNEQRIEESDKKSGKGFHNETI